MIARAIRDFIAQRAYMVVVTGSMSVAPDDGTPMAIREAGADTVCYGAPVYLGAMFLLDWVEGVISRYLAAHR